MGIRRLFLTVDTGNKTRREIRCRNLSLRVCHREWAHFGCDRGWDDILLLDAKGKGDSMHP